MLVKVEQTHNPYSPPKAPLMDREPGDERAERGGDDPAVPAACQTLVSPPDRNRILNGFAAPAA